MENDLEQKIKDLKTFIESKTDLGVSNYLGNQIREICGMVETMTKEDIISSSGAYIWLVEDCDDSSILSAHLTEEAAEKERERLRVGYASRVDFRVYSILIS